MCSTSRCDVLDIDRGGAGGKRKDSTRRLGGGLLFCLGGGGDASPPGIPSTGNEFAPAVSAAGFAFLDADLGSDVTRFTSFPGTIMPGGADDDARRRMSTLSGGLFEESRDASSRAAEVFLDRPPRFPRSFRTFTPLLLSPGFGGAAINADPPDMVRFRASLPASHASLFSDPTDDPDGANDTDVPTDVGTPGGRSSLSLGGGPGGGFGMFCGGGGGGFGGGPGIETGAILPAGSWPWPSARDRGESVGAVSSSVAHCVVDVVFAASGVFRKDGFILSDFRGSSSRHVGREPGMSYLS